jgi:HlyD family secretion protein
VKLNQNTIIKVDGYPFQEFGKLIGEISFLAQNANEANKYYVAISLPNTLETDKKIVINIQNGMTGTMEIITKKTRLLNRIIYSLTDLIDAATHKKVKK